MRRQIIPDGITKLPLAGCELVNNLDQDTALLNAVQLP